VALFGGKYNAPAKKKSGDLQGSIRESDDESSHSKSVAASLRLAQCFLAVAQLHHVADTNAAKILAESSPSI